MERIRHRETEDRDAATRAVDLAQREVNAAAALLIALVRDGTPAHDPAIIGTRLRLLMAETARREAQLWLRRAGRAQS